MEVTAEKYSQLHTELADLTERIAEMDSLLAKANERLSVVETGSASVVAVKELLNHVAELKAEVNKIKFSLGIDKTLNAELQAMLNGEPISND